MSAHFEKMNIMDNPAAAQMMQAPPTNYFQHLQERPNMQNEMNSLWDSAQLDA